MKLRYAAVGAALATTAAFGVAPAEAAPGARVSAVQAGASAGHIHVLVPPSQSSATRAKVLGSTLPYTGGLPPLIYDRSGATGTGPQVAKTMKVYVIWWNPGHLQSGAATKIPSSYKSLIVRFMHDYSKNGLANNNTQYYGYSGTQSTHISNTTTYGGAFTNLSPFPTSQCSTSETGQNCVTDANIQLIAQQTAAAHQVNAGTSVEFFVYTPSGEGSCRTSGACASANASYTGYCAYHGYTNATYGTAANLLYANQPWPTDPGAGGHNCFATNAGQTFPNNNTNADASINVTSHELTESITDPLLNNWYDAHGFEIGDECAWEFSGVQVWNGHSYSLQPEASNASAGCVYNGP